MKTAPNLQAGARKTLANPSIRVPPPLVRRTLQDNVYDYIREGLMTGEFGPGEHLTVRGIAAAIGTSVMPVREAFRRLTSERALEPLSTGATRVPVFDLRKLQDITEIRITVEGLAARLAASRMTGKEFVALEQCNLDVQRAIDTGSFAAEAKANEHFHFCIYRGAHSTELLRIIEHLWLQIGPYLSWLLKQGKWPASNRGTRTFRHHRAIVLALRRHDADAAEAAVRKDLMVAADVMLELSRNILPT